EGADRTRMISRALRCVSTATLVVAARPHASPLPPAGGFELQRFHPASPSDGYAVMHDVSTQDPWTWAASFFLSYADHPLQFSENGKRVGGIVDGITGGELEASLGIGRRFEVDGSIPLTL